LLKAAAAIVAVAAAVGGPGEVVGEQDGHLQVEFKVSNLDPQKSGGFSKISN